MATIPTSPEKIARYQILGELGRGAMGRVYRAFDPNIGRNIALKVIPCDTADPEQAQRFRREAQAAGILSHPNIVTIYDAGEDAGFLYIAMELVDGPTVQQMLARGPIPLAQALSIAEQTAAALDHAHARSIVHRDIKPANIMVQDGVVKVADFGVAKSGMAGLTSTGQVLGTPSYLAPEVVKGGSADARSDIFSLGAVLYELFTGARAFPGDNISTVLYRVISEQPPAPTRVLSTLPPGLNYAVLKALAKEPAERYARCADLVADLRNHDAPAAQGVAAAQAPAPAAVFQGLLDQTVKLNAVKHAPGGVAGDARRDKQEGRATRARAIMAPVLSRRMLAWGIAAVAVVMLAAAGLMLRNRRGVSPQFAAPGAAETASDQPASGTAHSGSATAPSPATGAAAAQAERPPGALSDDVSNAVPNGYDDKPSAFGAPLPPPGTPSTYSSASSPNPPGAASSAAMGRLVVHTEPPGARILLNGRETEYRTPVNFAVASGRYELTVARNGFSDETREIIVEPNRALQVRIPMKRSRRLLRLLPFRH